MDQQEEQKQVKTELLQCNPSFNSPPLNEQHHQLEDEEAATLVQLSYQDNINNTPNPDNSLGKRIRKPTEKKEMMFQMKKSVSETSIKQITYEEIVWHFTALSRSGRLLSIQIQLNDPASSDPSGKSRSHKKKGDNSPVEAKSPAMIRAEEVQLNLEPELPSFAKSLVRSHVGSCFWMGLPGPFCRTHLPHADTTVTIEDESGELFEIKYIGYKTGLSAGWRQYCVAHNLLEGDVLIFQLIGPRRFKVYIIRAHDLSELDGALGLLNLDAQVKQDDAEIGLVRQKSSKKKPKSLPLAMVRNKKTPRKRRSATPYNRPASEQSGNDSEEVGSEVLEGHKLSTSTFQFNNIKSLDDFCILVDGVLIDSELPETKRKTYYDLCCSQNRFLHEKIISGMNYKLIVGAISETVNIADSLSSCKLTTSREDFSSWERSLRAFELLGMNVGFLRDRLNRLLKLAFESEGASDTKQYVEAQNKKISAEEELRSLEAKLDELKEDSKAYEAEIGSLKSKVEGCEDKFKDEVTAPW
ncbi:hypothetical protein ACFE04_001552 [Oxalis oulophora]